MIMITVNRPLWLMAGEEAVIRRIAMVVIGHDDGVAEQPTGYKWALNQSGNDWWASGIEDGILRVDYRYGNTPGSGGEQMMIGLEEFLAWIFTK